MWLFEESIRDGVEDFLILSGKHSLKNIFSMPFDWEAYEILLVSSPAPGDHLYRMDYRDFVRKHKETGAAITIAALPCDEKVASAFGLMKIDGTGRVIDFAEKPKGDLLQRMRVDTTILGVSPEV